MNIIGKFLLKRADGVRVDTKTMGKYMQEVLKIEPQKVYKLPVFVNTKNFFNKDSGKSIKNKFLKYKNTILFVGRLAPEKNIENMIRAAEITVKKYPETLFLIVGSGPEEKYLKSMVREMCLDKNVIFEGFVRDVIPYYHACDIFVLPSHHEGRPIVLVEAMACGKPVISTDISGAYDVITESKTGFVVPRRDSEALAKKIDTLLSDLDLIAQMGAMGRELVIEGQDMEKNAHLLADMCKDVIGNYSLT